MKNLYTITFDSDSTSEEEVKSPVHPPEKPLHPANSNARIRPLPMSPKIKITTRNLSEESRNQSYSSFLDSNSKISRKEYSQKDSLKGNSKENGVKRSEEANLESQTNITEEISDDEYEREEKGFIKQSKSYVRPNLKHHQQHLATPQTPNIKYEHHTKIHRNSHHRNKSNNDINGIESDNNQTNINVNQDHEENRITEDINSNANHTSNHVDSTDTVLNEQIHNNNGNNDNINLSDVIQSNSTSSNLITSSSSFQQLVEPLHFTITRQMKTKSIFNKKNSFTFTDSENNCLFEAKPEKGSQSLINIYCGSQYDQITSQIPSNLILAKNESSNQFGVIICSPDMDSFSLRLNNQYGCEIMSVRVNSKKCKNSSSSTLVDRSQKGTSHNELNPNFDLNGTLRILKVNFFYDGPKKIEKKLQNAESYGVPLNFGQRNVIPSTKNFILLDNLQREFVAIRKIEKNNLCVDFQPTIPAFCAFAIGLIAFLYKV